MSEVGIFNPDAKVKRIEIEGQPVIEIENIYLDPEAVEAIGRDADNMAVSLVPSYDRNSTRLISRTKEVPFQLAENLLHLVDPNSTLVSYVHEYRFNLSCGRVKQRDLLPHHDEEYSQESNYDYCYACVIYLSHSGEGTGLYALRDDDGNWLATMTESTDVYRRTLKADKQYNFAVGGDEEWKLIHQSAGIYNSAFLYPRKMWHTAHLAENKERLVQVIFHIIGEHNG